MFEYEVCEGDIYSVDLAALYFSKLEAGQVFDEQAQCRYGTIQRSGEGALSMSDDYFDFRDEYGNLICMDGEEAEVEENSGERITLLNRNGEYDVSFSLSFEEFEICCLGQ